MRRIEQRLNDLRAQQRDGTYTLCPRCGRDAMQPELRDNALSRVADVMICAQCGAAEAKLAYMQNPGSVYTWSALQPRKPESDFRALAGSEVWERIRDEQRSSILELYRRYVEGAPEEEIRYEAQETLPGLANLWVQPFHLRYRTADGVVVVQVVESPGGAMIVADLIEKGSDDK